jgi:hypothetical protein
VAAITLLVVASLLNGIPSYLRRVGAVQKDRYEAYWVSYCGPEGAAPRAFGFGRVCRQPDYWGASSTTIVSRYSAYALEVQAADLLFKLPKDLAMVATAVLGFALWRLADKKPSNALPLTLLAVTVIMAVPLTITREGGWACILGLRSYLFLLIAFLGAFVTAQAGLDRLGTGVALLLVLQLLFIPWELFSGISTFRIGPPPFHLPRRLSADFIMPNALGSFAAMALALCMGAAVYRRHAISLWAVAILVVVLSGSATASVVLAVLFVAAMLGDSVPPTVRGLILGVVVVGALIALPLLLDRPDLFDSIVGPGGRWGTLLSMAAMPASVLMFGEGLAARSNTVIGLAHGFGTDSQIILLLSQTGVLGLACFYFILAWAWSRDPRLRPFYVALTLCSITLNVTEAYPVNFLLGLALAHSATEKPPAPTMSRP